MKTKRILPLSDNGFDMAHGFSSIQYRQRVDNVMQWKLTNHIFINQRNLLFISVPGSRVRSFPRTVPLGGKPQVEPRPRPMVWLERALR